MGLLHEITPKYLSVGSPLVVGTYDLDDVVVTFSGTITCSKISLGTTCQGRMVDGSNGQGKELVEEKWLELDAGSGFVPVGGGILGDTVELTGTKTLSARLNIPEGASTTGDFVANLELFYTE